MVAPKLDGEQGHPADLGCPHLILRTSWLYSGRGHNFVLTMLRLARERQIIRVVNDQVGAPTWARSLSDISAQMIDRLLHLSPPEREEWSGTYHATAQGVTSWFGFARAIFDRAASAGLVDMPSVEPISSRSHPSPVRRPRNSVLDNTKLRAAFNLALPRWESDLTVCIRQLAGERQAEFPENQDAS